MTQRRSTEERIEIMRARLTDLENKAKKERRKKDTRRKIVAGAILLNSVEHDDRFRDWFVKRVATLSKRDQALFDDLALPNPEAQAS